MRGWWRIQRAGERLADLVGYDRRNWLRIAQIESFRSRLADLAPRDVLEISPGWNTCWKHTPGAEYVSVDFPAFDICKDALERRFGVVIADQVLEHVPRPLDAARNIRAMLAPGGTAMIATPFLFRVHARPYDFSRWTEAGLRSVLEQSGFSPDAIETFSWGNRACAKSHIGGPVKSFGFGRDMRNEPEYPLMVWAFARA